MRCLLAIAIVAVCGGVACNINGLNGQCTSDSNCQSGAVCESGYCVSHQCRPACSSSQICDPQTVTCNAVTVPSITVNSPASGSFAGLSLQASATARAPGGVSSLTFEVQSTGGAVLTSAPGVASSTDASIFTASIPLNGAGIPEGAAVFVTRITYQTTQTFSAAPVAFQIDKTPPTISMGAYDGRTAPFVGPGNATATVTAIVTDTASGVDPAQVKLTLIGGDGSTFVSSPGTGGVYTFSVPRTSLNTTDGFVGSISFKIDAKDLVNNAAPSLTGNPTEVIRVDNAKPSVSIVTDTTWYAATAGTLTVSASISDADSGLVASGNTQPFLKIGASGTPVLGTQGAGSTWTFAFDPSVQAANTESPVQFTVTAQDVAGNVQIATGSRNIDNKPPTISSLEVFLAGAADPAQQGVIYPAQPAAAVNGLLSGHNGSHFIFNDSVHIKGTFSDNGAGLSGASLRYRLDGVGPTGAGVPGAEQPLGGACADGSATCSFDVPSVPLNDLTRIVSFDAATGNLTLTFLGEDVAKNAAGGAAHNMAAPITTPVATTRLWWSRQFSVPTGTVAVSGIAIHPNGDVLVGNNATAAVETLFALFRDGPFNANASPTRSEDWKKTVGGLVAAPVVGTGGSGTANVYVASNTLQRFFAVGPSGADVWSSAGVAIFGSTPTVVPNQHVFTATNCEAVVSAGGTDVVAACQDQTVPTAAVTKSVSVTDPVGTSPVTFAGGNIFVGTLQHVAQTSFATDISGNGILSSAVTFTSIGPGPFTGVVSNGTALFAATTTTHSAYSFTFASGAFSLVWGPTDITAAIQGQPILTGTNLLFNTSDGFMRSITAATGANNTPTAVPSPAYTPLLGADGNIYVGRNSAIQALSGSGAPLWSLAVPANATVAPNLDCGGVLYAAAADTVYALITDMVSTPTNAGLSSVASTWPKYQRDSRNSGNGDATTVKWGMRINATTCTQ